MPRAADARLRRGVLFGAPLLGYAAGMVHPTHLSLAGNPWLYIGLHLALPALIGLLGWMIMLLVEGVENRAAAATRLLVPPFVIAYTVYTAFSGLAYGVLVWKAGDLPTAEQPGAVALIHDVFHNGVETALYLTAAVLWIAAVLAAAIALRGRAPAPALVLLAAGAVVYARSHERPWGPAGMAVILAAVVWLDLSARSAQPSQLLKALRPRR